MKLSMPGTVRPPVILLLAFFVVVYANAINRCADGYCYTYGWPWVAYYGWSDAGFGFDGQPTFPRIEWWPAFGDAIVAVVILLVAWTAQRRWRLTSNTSHTNQDTGDTGRARNSAS